MQVMWHCSVTYTMERRVYWIASSNAHRTKYGVQNVRSAIVTPVKTSKSA